jgi:hypothetical protein
MRRVWMYLWIVWAIAIIGFSAWGEQPPGSTDPTVKVVKIACPGDTDFYPIIQADVIWSLYPERHRVAVTYDPCKDAEAIINQGKVKVK